MAEFDYPYPLAVEAFPAIRQSLLSAFDNCSLSAAYDVEYREGWSTAPQARGQIFHRFAGKALRAMAEMGEETIPVAEALEILRETLRQDDIDRVCPTCGTEEILPGIGDRGMRTCKAGHRFESEYVNVPTAMVKDLYWVVVKWANDNAFDVKNLVDVELELRAEVRYPHPAGGTVPRTLKGTLDVLFVEGAYADHAVVLDWKDMWALPPEHDEGEDDEISFLGYFQQRMYALLIFKRFPSVTRVTLREFYVRFSQPREVTISRESEAEIEAELSALAERFDRLMHDYLSLPARRRVQMRRTGKLPFQPTPGKHCGFCMRPAACPIPVFARAEGRIVSAEDALRVTKQLLVAEPVVKDARKDLRAYAEQHGPIEYPSAKGRRAFGFVETTRTSRPTLEEIEKAIVEKGGPLNWEEMKALYKTKTTSVFKSHTPVEYDETADDLAIQRKLVESIAAAGGRHLQLVQD